MTHCGVLEFVADEGICYLPHWVKIVRQNAILFPIIYFLANGKSIKAIVMNNFKKPTR